MDISTKFWTASREAKDLNHEGIATNFPIFHIHDNYIFEAKDLNHEGIATSYVASKISGLHG